MYILCYRIVKSAIIVYSLCKQNVNRMRENEEYLKFSQRDFQKRLKDLRGYFLLTQADVAKEIGWKKAKYINIEGCKQLPNPSQLMSLFSYFHDEMTKRIYEDLDLHFEFVELKQKYSFEYFVFGFEFSMDVITGHSQGDVHKSEVSVSATSLINECREELLKEREMNRKLTQKLLDLT